MPNTDQIIEQLLDDYDAAVDCRQVSLAQAIEITDQLIDALQERLQALHDDEKAPDPQ